MDLKKNKKELSPLIRFTSMGFQMGIIIAFFTWLGIFLDDKYKTKTPWWTIGLSLFGVCASLYLIIKEVMKMGKNEE